MISINPDGVVKLMKGVGLDRSYTDTYTFVSSTEQQWFFNKKVAYTFENVAPVRIPNTVRLPIQVQAINDCDYLCFQNTHYSNKWFYAFIVEARWLNANACEIAYEIDIVQTWYFSYVFPEMFIVREHTNDDTVGKNLVSENLETGEMIVNDYKNTGFFEDWTYCAFATINKSGANSLGRVYGGIYSGLIRNDFPTYQSLNTWLLDMVEAGKADGIVSILMMPTHFLGEGDELIPTIEEIKFAPNWPSLKPGANIDGYFPRNNKLWTFPYNYLLVSNHQGTAGTFKYEFFDWKRNISGPLKCVFHVTMDETANPTATLIPFNYRNNTSAWGDIDSQITLTSFPQCAWAADTYKAWLAQNANTLNATIQNNLTELNVGAAGAVLTALSGNPGGALQQGVNLYVNAETKTRLHLAQLRDKAVLPAQAHGAQSGYTQVALQVQDFYFYNMTITSEYAKIIDGFFDLYGYQTNQIKTPNIVGRTSWNYVQTEGAVVLGNAPEPAANKMEELLNNGIRFWHGDYIGQYHRNNAIVPTSRNVNMPFVNLAGEQFESITTLKGMIDYGP